MTTPPLPPSPPPEPIPGFAMPPDGVMEQVYAAKPPSPPRAGATGEIPTNERIAALRSEVLKYEESAARYGTSHSLPFVLDALCGSQHAATRTAVLAELAARAGEEVKQAVEGLTYAVIDDMEAGREEFSRSTTSYRDGIYQMVAALAAQRDEADNRALRLVGEIDYLKAHAPVSAPASTSRAAALEEAAKVADGFKMRREAIWLAQSERPDRERDLASEQAHRERGNEAGQIAEAIRALGPGDAPAREGKDV